MNTHYKVQGKALELANAFGFLFPGEVFLIQAIAQSLKDNAVMVCLGTGVGTGSLAMAEMKPDAKLYSIDISEGGPYGGLENERNAFYAANIHPYPLQTLGDSTKVHSRWDVISKNAKIDFLFIDADHSEEALTKDIDGWALFVRKGGYIAFHDYESVNWHSVTSVVDEKMKDGWRLVHAVDTLIVFQKVISEVSTNKNAPAKKGNRKDYTGS